MRLQHFDELHEMLTPEAREKAVWIIVLLPGFITIGTARLTSNLPGLSDFDLGILYFVATVLNSGLALGVAFLVLRARTTTMSLEQLARSPWLLGGLFFLSLLTGVMLAIAYEGAWANRTVRYFAGRDALPRSSPHDSLRVLLRNSHASGRFDDWRSLSYPRELRVLRIYAGKEPSVTVGVRAHSHSAGEGAQVYLSPACVVEKGEMVPIQGPGSWISLKEVVRIDFLDASKVKCIQDLLPKQGEEVPPTFE